MGSAGTRYIVEQKAQDDDTEATRVGRGKRRADAAIAHWQLGDAEKVSDVLKVDQDPESLTQTFTFCYCGTPTSLPRG